MNTKTVGTTLSGTYIPAPTTTVWDTNTTIWDYFPTSTTTLATYWNQQAKMSGSFPPYNILNNDDNTEFVLSLAVAGFSADDLEVTVKENKLIIKGEMKEKELSHGFAYTHKGIAERSFTRTFNINEYIEVKGVTYSNGMLDVSLHLVLPESKKPKKFQINTK